MCQWNRIRIASLLCIGLGILSEPVCGQVAPPIPKVPTPKIPAAPAPKVPTPNVKAPASNVNAATAPGATANTQANNLANQAGPRTVAGSTSGGSVTQPAINPNSGVGGFNGLQNQLNLSSSQLSQLNQFQSNFNQEIAELRNRYLSDPQGTTSLFNQARQQLQQQVNSVLTPQQRVTLSQLTGIPDPFSGDTSVPGNPSLNNGMNGFISGKNVNNSTTLNSQLLTSNPQVPGSSSAIANSANSSQIPSTLNFRQTPFYSSNAATETTNNLAGSTNNPTATTSNLTGSTNNPTGTSNNPAGQISGLQQQLNLSSSQLSQINRLQSNFNQELTELKNRYLSDPEGTTSLFSQARQQLQQQLNSVLTPQQRVALSQITGSADPFTDDSALVNPANAINPANAGSASTSNGVSGASTQNGGSLSGLTNGLYSTGLANGSLFNSLGGGANVSNIASPQQAAPSTQAAAANGSNQANSSALPQGGNAMNQGAGSSSIPSAQNSGASGQLPAQAAQGKTGTSSLLQGLNQMTLKDNGNAVLNDPNLQRKLGITVPQSLQLRQLQLDYIQSLGDLSGRFKADPRAASDLYESTSRLLNQRVMSVLTPLQRSMLDQINNPSKPVSGSSSGLQPANNVAPQISQ